MPLNETCTVITGCIHYQNYIKRRVLHCQQTEDLQLNMLINLSKSLMKNMMHGRKQLVGISRFKWELRENNWNSTIRLLPHKRGITGWNNSLMEILANVKPYMDGCSSS